jgi:membrane associated rhomboid family serine protease
MFPLYSNNPTERAPLVTYALIVLNVVAFLSLVRLPGWEQEQAAYRWGFVPARMIQLRQPHPIFVPIDTPVHVPFLGDRIVPQPFELPAKPGQIWLSLLTCMFLHGGWMHLLGNMWFLWLFGNNVEDRLGPVPYLLLYLLGGILATMTHWVIDSQSTVPVIGASGAIATVLGAYAVTWPWAQVRTLVFLVFFVTIIDVPALVFLGVWFVAQLLAGRQSLVGATPAGVAWWAHVGGFLAGMAMMPLLSLAVHGGDQGGQEHAQ